MIVNTCSKGGHVAQKYMFKMTLSSEGHDSTDAFLNLLLDLGDDPRDAVQKRLVGEIDFTEVEVTSRESKEYSDEEISDMVAMVDWSGEITLA